MNKPPRQSHDDAIDQALASLRTAEPVEGFEARILTSLRQREFFAPSSAPLLGWPWRVALTLATALAMLAAFLLRTPHPNATSQAVPTPTHTLLSTTAIQPRPQPPVPRQAPVPSPRTPSPLQPNLLQPAELTSFPAPPAPLTTQERLLLQVAHRGDPQVLELLNPEIAARELAQNMADFDNFFPSPPIIPSPNPTPNPTINPSPIQTPETSNDAHSTVR